MTTLRDDISDLFYGRKPLHRINPQTGQSEWYYMTPKNPNDLDDGYDYVDVPTQDTPNPLLQKSFVNQTMTPVAQNETNPLPSTPTANLPLNDETAWQKLRRYAEAFANGTEATALTFTGGRSFGTFDELSGIGGGIVGIRKAVMNNQNPWNGFVDGYTAVRNDMRRKQKEATENYPWLSKPMEFFGGGYAGKGMHIAKNAILSGIGYAETPDDIKDTTVSNMAGNVIASYIPTQILPPPINYIANEYISRYSPNWLKDFNNE